MQSTRNTAMVKKGKQISPFIHFLDTHYIPMAARSKLGVALLLLAVPVIVYVLLCYMPYTQEKKTLTAQKIKLESELGTVRVKTRTLEQLEKELAETKETFNSEAALLPETKEIPKLLKDISSLGTAAGLEFLSFKPLSEQAKDFYEEIPISISLKGTYHGIGHFFDSVSKLERIVSVGDMKVGSPAREDDKMVLKADCQLVTYRFTNEELAKPRTSAETSSQNK